jgi:MFS family permease
LRKDIDLAAIAVIATVASIVLHYVGGLFGGLLSGMIAFTAYHRGLRRWAALILAAAALAALFIFASVLLQASNWAADFDHSWIDLPGIKALGIPVALAVTAICYNPVPLAGLWLAQNRRSEWERRFITIIGGVLVAGIAIILMVHAFRPIVVERYLIAIPVLVSALMAVPAARFVQAYPLVGLLALVSVAVAVAAAPMAREGVKPRWREDAQTIAKIVADCPTTQVYAASGWALGPAAETRTAHREDPVFERAYRLLASRHGYEVHFISLGATAHATPGSCPVVLWYEHTPNLAEDDLPAAIDDAGLTGLHGARLSAFRSATGFVVRADRP